MPLLESVFNVLLDIAPGSWAIAFLKPVLAVVILTLTTGILIKALLRKQAAENKKQASSESDEKEKTEEEADK